MLGYPARIMFWLRCCLWSPSYPTRTPFPWPSALTSCIVFVVSTSSPPHRFSITFCGLLSSQQSPRPFDCYVSPFHHLLFRRRFEWTDWEGVPRRITGRQSYPSTPKNVSGGNKGARTVAFGCCVWSGTDEKNSVSRKPTWNLPNYIDKLGCHRMGKGGSKTEANAEVERYWTLSHTRISR